MPGRARAEGVRPLSECEAMVRRATRSLEGYICLFGHQGAGRAEVLRFLDGQLRKDPQNPRPRLYAGIIRSLGGEAVDDQEWRAAIAGFAREKDVTGEVYATTSLISARCIGRLLCDVETRALLWRTGELGRASGKVDLQQVAEIWAMKVAFAVDDMDGAAAAEARLQALGPPRSAWLRSESLQARAHLAALLLDHERQRTLYRDLLDTLDADDPRRPAAVGGMASAVAHLALRGLENPTAAERLLREAIDLQERAGLPVLSARTGYLAARVQLAILLGPTAESLSLLRSALAAHLARSRSSGPAPMYSRLALAEFLATSEPPRLEEAMEVSQAAVEDAFLTSGDYEKARTLVLRSRMSFRLGRLSPGRADGLAALDLAERLRDQQRSMPLRLRYAQSLSFAYQSLAGALTRSRAPGDASALDDSFQVMERLRARGLMETLLVEGAAGEPVQVQPPTLAQVQGELGPGEALLSFQVWQPEPDRRRALSRGELVGDGDHPGAGRGVPDPGGGRPGAADPRLDRTARAAGSARTGWRARGSTASSSGLRSPRSHPQIDRLIVVPDGPLHRLPFDALSEGPGTPYLAERFAISIEPSAALWLRFRAAPRQPPGRLLVLADPAEPPVAGSVLRGSGGVFGALAHARREAQAALAAFSGGGELRTGPPASEAFLKSAGLRGVSMLHFATHAVTDERDPEHAAVVLAPGSASEDGRLEPGEIARLPLEGKTVVLAGCETSAGPLYRGEGVMSLARAFFGAGATAVVGTLDRARDDEAGVFFSAMYSALGRGASIGDAVSAAKREGIPPGGAAGGVGGGGAARGRAGAATRGGRSRSAPAGPGGGVVAFAGLGTGPVGARAPGWVRENQPVERLKERHGDVTSLPPAGGGGSRGGGSDVTFPCRPAQPPGLNSPPGGLKAVPCP